jgi:hypothetical protein
MELIRSYRSVDVGLPHITVGSAPALSVSRPAHLLSVHSGYNLQTRRVALCDPFHRRLQRLGCLHRCSDCYRVERSSSRAGLSSRCGPTLFTAHRNDLFMEVDGL